MRSALILIATALPAAAHEGAHLHPHGSEGWLSVIAALTLIAGAGLVARKVRVKK